MKRLRDFLSPLRQPFERSQVPMMVVLFSVLSTAVIAVVCMTGSLWMAGAVLLVLTIIEAAIYCFLSRSKGVGE
jgi:hypothetical protein